MVRGSDESAFVCHRLDEGEAGLRGCTDTDTNNDADAYDGGDPIALFKMEHRVQQYITTLVCGPLREDSGFEMMIWPHPAIAERGISDSCEVFTEGRQSLQVV